jgi:hypothetical protein
VIIILVVAVHVFAFRERDQRERCAFDEGCIKPPPLKGSKSRERILIGNADVNYPAVHSKKT